MEYQTAFLLCPVCVLILCPAVCFIDRFCLLVGGNVLPDPSNVDFVIPANDDATKSIEVILDACCAAMIEGLEERKAEKIDMEAAGEAPANKGKKKSVKARLDKSDEEVLSDRLLIIALVVRYTTN